MSTALDNARVEVAFSADPSTTTPSWVDMTSRVKMGPGISITRGRQDQFGSVSPGSCSLVLDNTDAALTPSNASSPYYPNVKPQNRIRVTHRDPAAAGNMLALASSSFEVAGSVGDWVAGGSAPPTLSNSTTRFVAGSRSMLVTWGAGGSLPSVSVTVGDFVIGRTYTASLYVWVPTGDVHVSALINGIGFGDTSSTNDAWERISVTFEATDAAHTLALWPSSTPAGGEEVWVDAVQIDEGDEAVGFTTTSPVITGRFDGYVEEWPLTWPLGGQEEAVVAVTAYDLQSRLSRAGEFESVIAETYDLETLVAHWPLSESSGASSALDRVGGQELSIVQVGAGGELQWGQGTGPGTDGAAALVFVPASADNGLYLQCAYPFGRDAVDYSAMAVTFATDHTGTDMTLFELTEGSGDFSVAAGVSGDDGDAFVEVRYARTITTITGSSAPLVNDGSTHQILVVNFFESSQWKVAIYFDGSLFTTVATGATWPGPQPPVWQRLNVGYGLLDTPTSPYTKGIYYGTMSHVAAWTSLVDATSAAAMWQATSTGFAGETADERIERIASWIGLDSSFLDLETCDATLGTVDSTGMDPWSYMQLCATSEAGFLYVSTDGKITLRNRTRLWDSAATAAVSVTAEDLGGPGLEAVTGLQRLVNDVTVSRSGSGGEVSASDADSIAAYGKFGQSITVALETDAATSDRAEWEVAAGSTTNPYIPNLELDGLTSSVAAAVRVLDLGDRVTVSSLPSQAPDGIGDLRVEGYTELISAGAWSITANTVPFLLLDVLELDDATYGVLGSNRLAF